MTGRWNKLANRTCAAALALGAVLVVAPVPLDRISHVQIYLSMEHGGLSRDTADYSWIGLVRHGGDWREPLIWLVVAGAVLAWQSLERRARVWSAVVRVILTALAAVLLAFRHFEIFSFDTKTRLLGGWLLDASMVLF